MASKKELADLKQQASQLPALEETWRSEIERRLAEIDRGEVEPMPGDQVFARLRRRFG